MASGDDTHAATAKGATERAESRDEARRARRALLALEVPASLDFDDPALEWRRLFSEILGTFLLVLAGAGVVAAVSGGAIGRSAAVNCARASRPAVGSPP
jgi:aquaporin Z